MGVEVKEGVYNPQLNINSFVLVFINQALDLIAQNVSSRVPPRGESGIAVANKIHFKQAFESIDYCWETATF